MVEQPQQAPQRALIIGPDFDAPPRPTQRCDVVAGRLVLLGELERCHQRSFGQILPFLVQPRLELVRA
ncbi:MAG: hypothetical protein AUG85_01620 [Gemmatimonadetes bacterium 13_1_20CM_4_66_11]|nr:MAG: hypothetical protein AUG85_01620 [Gemmatimonadetes bacterium 13_1_20CM_4_66_11]